MSYNYFAKVYDDLTENIDYKVRSEYISGLFADYGVGACSTLLDLACGTGTFSKLFADKGFEVTGVDLSTDMLEIASNKTDGKVLLINANMQDFVLQNPVDACICCLDSINHLNGIDEVKKTFENVRNSLKEKGIFIFDVNTVYKHNCILADNTFVFDEEEYFLSWDNELLEENKVRMLIDIFALQDNGDYKRYSEEFTETAYEIEELKDALSPYFNVLKVLDDLSDLTPNETSERVYFVCERI